jgi:voltage-gated potassium channel
MITRRICEEVANDPPETSMDAALQELFHRSDRVPFVYWRAYTGTDTTVLLIGAVAVLAFVTGLSHISQGNPAFDGPLAAVLPDVSATAVAFGAILLAFVLGGLTIGLQRRLWIAWYGAALALPLASLLPLVTAEPTDVLLFVLSLGTLPLIVRNRAAFDRSVDLSGFQIAAIVAFVAGQLYGTVGAYALREHYNNIDSWIDAFYYVIVTATTVGYGDVTPNSPTGKLFTASAIIVVTGTFALASGSLIVPALESRLTAAFGTMTASELALMEDHVVVLGYGDLTEPLVDELVATTDVVVVTPDADTASALDEKDVNVLTADPTDEDALLDARIDAASGVVAATADDAQDTLAVLAAREENPDVRVVAAATDHGHVGKLERVGADEVISPSVIVGRQLGQSVLGDADASANGAEATETDAAGTDDTEDDGNEDTT